MGLAAAIFHFAALSSQLPFAALSSQLRSYPRSLPPLAALLDARTAPMGLAIAIFVRNKPKAATRSSLSQTGASGALGLLGRSEEQ